MPTNRALALNRPYMEDARVPEHRESALKLIHHTLALSDALPIHKRELLGIGIWKWTEAEGFPPYAKYHLRLRSMDAIEIESGAKVIHEHVWQRKWLIDQLLARDAWTLDELRDFLERYAIACVVTTDEHTRLGQSQATGWRRYVDAGVRVWDMLLDAPFVFPEEAVRSVADKPTPEPAGGGRLGEGVLDVESAIAEYAGPRESDLRKLLTRLEGEDVAIVVGVSRDGGVGQYLRVHDLSMGEPSPAVAYLHWSGRVSVRLTTAELPSYFTGDQARPAADRNYGVSTKLDGDRSLDVAEALIVLALEKARAL